MAAISGLERGTELGQGLFSLANLRAYMALSGQEQDSRRVLPWLTDILHPVDHQRHRPDYSFGDLISLFVVRELKKKGLRTRVIRDAEDYLRRKWNTDRPFVREEIQTDGCGIFVDDELVAGGQIESAERHGQQVLREAVKEKLRHVKYDEGWASSWNPAQHVIIDPHVQFGEPVVAGTRIPTSSLVDMAAWAPIERIAAEMGITKAKAEAGLAFERRLQVIQN